MLVTKPNRFITSANERRSLASIFPPIRVHRVEIINGGKTFVGRIQPELETAVLSFCRLLFILFPAFFTSEWFNLAPFFGAAEICSLMLEGEKFYM